MAGRTAASVAASDTDLATLNIAPLSVGLQLRGGLSAGRTVILTSATNGV